MSLKRSVGRFLTAAVLSLVAGTGIGCRGGASHAASPAPEQHPIRGTVVRTDPARSAVVLRHEAIPGFMSAMTMEYPVSDRSVAAELHPGDRIVATLDVDRSVESEPKFELTGIDVIAQARPDYKPTVQYHVPAAGELVPDFKLLDQSNEMVSLAGFRGKVLVMTFIYTRCPLADYCPRMSRNFAEIDKSLQGEAALYRQTHLLSVSFDPKNDTPGVLRSYGEAYTGRYVNETFGHWTFAAPPEAALPEMEQYFDLGVTPAADGTLQHSLATLVIGKDGRVVAFWPTNDWTVAEVMAKVRAAAAT